MKKKYCLIIVIAILLSFIAPFEINANEDKGKTMEISLNESKKDDINTFVETILKKSKVPGISIAIINNDQTNYFSYGYADKTKKTNIETNTLFELGSTSKAFTGLGILLLEDQGLLSLEDSVKDYIPWLDVYYKGTYEGKKIDGEVELTISNLLYHTSGFSYQTIGDIPAGNTDNLLKETVKTLADYELLFYPGSQMHYASINYDVLGYIIQIVSGQSYEYFIQENILKPLGLTQTYLFQEDAQATGLLSQGYKISFFQVDAYDAPRYRGNTPAGYVISNIEDMARWMKIQMGLIELPEQYQRIIEKSHIGNTTVATQGNYNYAAGWSVNIKGSEIYHYGNNPNYASAIIMLPEYNLGICVLTNMSAGVEGYLSRNILNILQGIETTKYEDESYSSMDTTFSLVFIGAILLGTASFVLLIIAIIEMIIKKRKREKLKKVKVAGILFAFPVMLFYGFCLYYLPNVLFSRYYIINFLNVLIMAIN